MGGASLLARSSCSDAGSARNTLGVEIESEDTMSGEVCASAMCSHPSCLVGTACCIGLVIMMVNCVISKMETNTEAFQGGFWRNRLEDVSSY